MTLRSVVVAAVLAVLPLCAAAQSAPVAIVNVSVVPMDRDRLLVGQTVVVADGKIAAMGSAKTVEVPAGAQRIDGAGKFLMPGLADMHVHLATSGDAARDEEENERLAVILLAHGITTARSMRGSPEILALRRRIDAGQLLGPRIVTTGPINGASQPNTRRVATVAEAESLVAADKAAGYDAIKLTNLPPEIYVAFLAAARREGIPAYGHVPRPVTFDEAARGGLGSAEHVIPFAIALVPPTAPRAANSGPGSLAPEHADWSLLPPLATKLRDSGVWVCPTLVVAQRFTSAEKRRRLEDSSMRYVPRRLRDAWLADVDNESVGNVPGLLDFGLTLTKRLHDAGVGLLLGSDDMNPYIVPGISLHEELALFVKAGLSPFEALRAGTSGAATFLKRDREFGTVAVGQRGDLLLLEANPLENVANAGRRVGVLVNGRWLPAVELQRRLREAGDAFCQIVPKRPLKGETMPLYLTKFSYTPATWGRLIAHPEDRRKAAQSYIESVGGKLHGFWYAFGTHDGYNLWEAPDNVSMAAVALAISGGGALSAFETTVLLTVDETMDAMRKAGKIGYRAPGA